MTIKDILTKYDMTQVQLSKELNISIHTINAWCASDSTLKKRICNDYIVSLIDMVLAIPERNSDPPQTVKDLLTKYDMSQTALSRRFGIPLRTVQNWVTDSTSHRDCPDYILHMMDIILKSTH